MPARASRHTGFPGPHRLARPGRTARTPAGWPAWTLRDRSAAPGATQGLIQELIQDWRPDLRGRSGALWGGQAGAELPPAACAPALRCPRSLSSSSAGPAWDAAWLLPKSALHHPLTLPFLLALDFSRLLISLASAFPSSSSRPSSPRPGLSPRPES